MKQYSWRADIDDYGPLIGEEAMAVSWLRLTATIPSYARRWGRRRGR
jgi:hypothetical protein